MLVASQVGKGSRRTDSEELLVDGESRERAGRIE